MQNTIVTLATVVVATAALFGTHAAAATNIAGAKARSASYVEAFNRRDAEACAKHWSEKAEYILENSGERIEGRKSIRKALDRLLDTDERFNLSVSDQRFRAVSDDVVVEEGTATLVSASHGFEQAQYLAIHVKMDGEWYRNSVREVGVVSSQSASQLGELSWLIGNWQRKDEHGSVRLDATWTANKHFIELAFVIRDQDGFELNGKQVIGWDPAAGVIRSWAFDSQGAFEVATWSKAQQQWLVKVSAVLPDGSTGSEQRAITRVDETHFTQEVVQQQINGQLMPGVERVTLTRVATGKTTQLSRAH